MEAIRVFRKRAGLTQEQLAERMGVRQPHVSRWEQGRVEPTRNNLERVADALGMLPWELRYAEELIERRDGVEKAVAEHVTA